MTGKMALIDKTDVVRSFADSELTCCQELLCFSHPGLDDILVRSFQRGSDFRKNPIEPASPRKKACG
jgi:hypothetical protein